MEQPHGFTFTDHTGDPTPDDDGVDMEEMERQWNEHEIVVDDPKEIGRIQSLMRVEERDGRKVLVVKDHQLDDALIEHDPDFNDIDFDDDGVDDEPDEGEDLFEDSPLGSFLAHDSWSDVDWDDDDSVGAYSSFVCAEITPLIHAIMIEAAGTSNMNAEPNLTRALAAYSTAMGAIDAMHLIVAEALGCQYNHLNEHHSKKDRAIWRDRVIRLLGEEDWNGVITAHPDIERFRAAFHRFNQNGCTTPVLVEPKNGGWRMRIIPLDDEGHYDTELVPPAWLIADDHDDGQHEDEPEE